MRIHIRHEIVHAFEPPARVLNAALRLTPRSHESQNVVRWRVDVDGDIRIRASDDAFGNCMHALSLAGPAASLRILVEGLVDTFDAAGIVRASVERFPPELFLRETPLTSPSQAHREMAASLRGENAIERLHALLLRIGAQGGAPSDDTQEQAQGAHAADADRIAKARAITHDFIACARLAGAPARFVSGYHIDAGDGAGADHCWAEAFVEGVGWIGFDPVNVICPHESHVRVAVGLDALDAAGVRVAPGPASVVSCVHAGRADARQS